LNDCKIDFECLEDPNFEHPRVEVRIKDAYGQEWPGPWIEIDEKKWTIKRSLFGSMERFIALLLEKHSGSLPIWLAPEPVRIVSVSEENDAFASALALELAKVNCLSTVDSSDKSVGQRVKAAILEKIPYIAVVGDKETRSNSVTLRQEAGGELNIATQAFIEEMADKIKGRI
jgi:threonyl-tRNA synthetase